MTESECSTVGTSNLGSDRSDDGCQMMEEPSKTLESYFHQKTYCFSTVQESNGHVAWQLQLAAFSYFQLGVVS